MKTIFTLLLALDLSALAASYDFLTLSGTTSASLVLAADDNQAARVVGAVATSDLAGSLLTFRTGTNTYTVSTANTNASATNLVLASVTGLASNSIIVVQLASGATTNATVWGTSGSTNLLLTAALGLAVETNTVVHAMGDTISLPVGNATANYQGECVYRTARGRPLLVTLTGTSACTINSIALRRE